MARAAIAKRPKQKLCVPQSILWTCHKHYEFDVPPEALQGTGSGRSAPCEKSGADAKDPPSLF